METETPVIDLTIMEMNESEQNEDDELEDIAEVDEDIKNEFASEEKPKEPEPEVGMMFDTVAELLHYYVKYGTEKGFPVKKRSSRKGDDGEVRWVVFACARSGKTESTSTKAFKMHLITKTNCKAKINSALCPDGKWRITSVVLDHNHSLSPGESRYYKKNRIMRSFVKRNLEITDTADIGSNKNCDSIVVEANGDDKSTVNIIVEHTKHLSQSIDTKKKKLSLPDEPVSHNVTAPEAQDAWGCALVKRAVGLVKSGMVISLGTGITASLAIKELGRLIKEGKLKDTAVVGANYQSRVLARQFGVKTVDLNDIDDIDIAFDGVDEVDFNKNLLKGGGAAHTMQKVVDSFAKQCVILADQSKVVLQLGTTFPVPVEVLPAAISPVLRRLVSLGGVPEIRSALRKDGPVVSDLGNMIVDVRFPSGIQNPADLEKSINMIPGVVENGIVSGIATSVLVAVKDGDTITVMDLEDFRKTIDVPSNANSLA